MKRYISFLFLLLLAACGNKDQKAQSANTPDVALTKSANSAAFNKSFSKILVDYYSMKDHFVAESDSASLNQSAKTLKISIDSLPLAELKADSMLVSTAKSFTEGISAELIGLIGEPTIDAKRRSFQMVSDQLYDLIRTVQYDQAVIFHPYCPMAFNDQGAYWLSNTREIKNPYVPKKMITCGDIKDSIDLRKRGE